MELRRDWFVGERLLCSEVPACQQDCASSLRFICVYCGETFLQAKAYVGSLQQPYRFLGKCCARCSDRGHRWNVPGSIECPDLLTWNIPKLALDQQLQAELNFLSHPEHPHNKDSNL